jgi:hypothetical protein
MNIAFWILIIIVLVLLWFCCSFAFKGLGAFVLKLYNDAKNEIVGKDEQKEKEKIENEG